MHLLRSRRRRLPTGLSAQHTSLIAEQKLGGFSGHLLNLAYRILLDQMAANLDNRLSGMRISANRA